MITLKVSGLVILVLLTGCLPTVPVKPNPETINFTIQSEQQDQQAANDIAAALEEHSIQICRQLHIDCRFPVVVEVFHNQDSFDQHVMDKEMRGFYAVSGQGKIQTVSPEVLLPGIDSSYEDRVHISVHEFAHIALDQIQPDLPAWLDEGAAVYLAPHDLYDNACRQSFPFQMVPALDDLLNDYESTPAADLFAFTLVSYLVKQHGAEGLIQLLQAGGEIHSCLGITTIDVETGWLSYLRGTCSSASN